ncbi:probable uridine nucleosidase 2 isoform X1 [Spodoptera litura]|uniref:Probable uridine nucleosidase 2 isoform X1 n=1 Tax=Spodoptera litura TaxID=69820 RepID=A0A9J7EE05_SPOLT|nr:probable uridine nucleosidase 2 isoform X1 [Spodoptera litura]
MRLKLPVMIVLRAIFVCLFVCVCVQCDDKKPKFIIDNDAGGDDAMAIFLGLLYEKYFDGPKLVALTTANGNTKEDNVYHNNQKVLKVANRQDVPIYRGSKESIVTTPKVSNYYGVDGLGDTGETFPDLVPAQTEGAVNALIKYSKLYEGNLTVITIGTLTNVALAIKLDPDFLSRLSHLYIGAGHIHSEKYPLPEFNARMDVEAYHIVVRNASPDKVTIFPFSQTKEYLTFSKDWRFNTLGKIDTEIIKEQNKYEKVALDNEETWQALDPATVALYLRPDLVAEYKYSKHDVHVCGDKRGIMKNDFVEKDKANVRVAYAVKAEDYKVFLLNVFGAELNDPSRSKKA